MLQLWVYVMSCLPRVHTQGLLGEKELATQVALLSAYSMVFTAALSISIGSNVRVGNLLGAGDHVRARRAAGSTVRLALSSALFLALALGLGRNIWPRLYGISADGMKRIVELAPVYATVQVRGWAGEGVAEVESGAQRSR